MTSSSLLDQLHRGIADLGQDPDEHPLEAYLSYLEELNRWNRAYNLTAIKDISGMISYHVLDSLSVLPYLGGPRCLDVGTGAGLPGMILALARPDTSWVLLDSSLKKTRFLQHILQVLKPANVEVVQSRVEDFLPDKQFDTIITRALTSLSEFHAFAGHLKTPDGQLLAMKGKITDKEMSEASISDSAVHELSVPGIGRERFLIVIK